MPPRPAIIDAQAPSCIWSPPAVNAAHLKTHLPNHPTQLYLIRHGEVEEKYHKVFGGSRIDMNLSPHGLRQAEALDAWLADTKLDAVYASPMKRVQQTMAPLLARRSVEPTIMQDLREIDFGDWTGHTWGGIHENFGINVFDWLEVLESPGAPNGESAQQLADRVRPCLIQVLHDNPHRTAAIVCHGGIIRVILALLLELPLAKMAHFNIEYASVTVIEINPERKHAAELELLNFQALR